MKDQPCPLSVLWDIDTPFLIALSEQKPLSLIVLGEDFRAAALLAS